MCNVKTLWRLYKLKKPLLNNIGLTLDLEKLSLGEKKMFVIQQCVYFFITWFCVLGVVLQPILDVFGLLSSDQNDILFILTPVVCRKAPVLLYCLRLFA
jgi:hypothetical protein